MITQQLLLWFVWALAAGTGAISWIALRRLKDNEKRLFEERERLPAACQYIDVNERLAAVQNRLNELQQQTSDFEQRKAERDQAIAQTEQNQKWLQENRDELLKIEAERKQQEELRQQLAAVQEQAAKLEANSQETKKQHIELEHSVIQLRQEKQILAENIAKLQTEQNLLQKSNRETMLSLDKQRVTLESLLKDITSEENRLIQIRKEAELVSREKREAIKERDEARAGRDSAKAEQAGILKSIETLKALAEGLRKDIAAVDGKAATGNYADLFVPIKFPKLAPRQDGQNEASALQKTADYIKGKRLVFPDRTLHAFHTSLKVNEISPLVVLAGISGTGKSELPRHYADGMGIHFLLSAVQPRWDSPQDLFGFYNYLEKRYKATELARAMVQFERYNQETWGQLPEGSELDKRSDRMLLVLLDEMNLARTEYYFSEFLSKLETRRSVRVQDASDRSKAEIELEMGGMLNGKRAFRLFPGQNILFVGTMNEDESTQTLSDKVLDRATVMRFWRPRKTNPNAVAPAYNPSEHGLKFDTWTSWIKKPEELGHDQTQVDDWIGQINGALTKIGRPFAYRVDRAIRSYIANYPAWVPSRLNLAMADQIEQRICPKLRGLETELVGEALTTIGEVVGQLNDPELSRAFRDSYEGQPTFTWRGIDRNDV